MVYVTRQLHMSVLSLGWLLSGYGIATMVSEGVIVRIVIPKIGEVNAVRLGLFAFTLQCIAISVSTSPFWIFVSILFSMFANLVYPSISSLVSRVVTESEQGEALGALNGIKAMVSLFLLEIVCDSVMTMCVLCVDRRLWPVALRSADVTVREHQSTRRSLSAGGCVDLVGTATQLRH